MGATTKEALRSSVIANFDIGGVSSDICAVIISLQRFSLGHVEGRLATMHGQRVVQLELSVVAYHL